MSIAIKLSCGGDLRRYTLPKNASFIELSDIITKLFPNLKPNKISINYRDPDNDIITVANDRDLQEAIRLTSFDPNNILRLCINISQEIPKQVINQNTEYTSSLESSWIVLPSLTTPIEPTTSISPPFIQIEKPVVLPSPVIIAQTSVPCIPPKRTSDICMMASEETRKACMRSADETLAQTQSLFSNSVEQCKLYSALARDICMNESSKILQTTEHIPSSIVKLSTEISDEIASRCSEICAQTLETCRTLPQSEKVKIELDEIQSCCMELSDKIAQDCRDASSLIAAQIMSL